MVLISFRGTVDVGNWLANLNVLSKGRPVRHVHRGFYFAFADVQGLLESRLDELRRPAGPADRAQPGRHPGRDCRRQWQGSRSVRAVYTYGQPAAGTSGYRDFIAENYADSYFRFVNEDDIVPRVPPGYVHVGHLIHFGEGGTLLAERARVVESSAAEPPMMKQKSSANSRSGCGREARVRSRSRRGQDGTGGLMAQRQRPQHGPLH